MNEGGGRGKTRTRTSSDEEISFTPHVAIMMKAGDRMGGSAGGRSESYTQQGAAVTDTMAASCPGLVSIRQRAGLFSWSSATVEGKVHPFQNAHSFETAETWRGAVESDQELGSSPHQPNGFLIARPLDQLRFGGLGQAEREGL